LEDVRHGVGLQENQIGLPSKKANGSSQDFHDAQARHQQVQAAFGRAGRLEAIPLSWSVWPMPGGTSSAPIDIAESAFTA
jgi:hypothetical protein